MASSSLQKGFFSGFALVKVAIVGIAIKHSQSPKTHSLFGKATKQKVLPQLHQISNSQSEFVKKLKELQQHNFSGATIAQPFKVFALSLCKEFSDSARYAGSVNAIKFNHDGTMHGENTDGAGFVDDLEINFRFSLKGKRVLMFGAGGAARGLLHPLFKAGVASIVVVNRTLEKAKEMMDDFKTGKYVDADLSLHDGKLDDIQVPFDLVINATSSSMEKRLPAQLGKNLVHEKSFCYDLFYQKEGLTVFEDWARSLKVRYANGIGMVVMQGIYAFALWTGKKLSSASVSDVIREFPFHRAIQPYPGFLQTITLPPELALIASILTSKEIDNAAKFAARL